MQLTHKKGMHRALTAATCTLLGVPTVASAFEFDLGAIFDGAKIDAAALFYSEKDGVTVFEPVIKLKKDFGDEHLLGIKLTFDTISGASPNGATPANAAQTFSSPSGNGTYTVDAGKMPRNPNFKDTRFAGDVSWSQPLDRLNSISFGASGSYERDYTSFGVNGSYSHDMNEKNTTLTAAVNLSLDQFKPQGGTPKGMGAVTVGTANVDGEEGNKTVIDLIFGVTQVVSRQDIMQFNFAYGSYSGYLNDPYKVISVVHGTTGDTVGYLYENRPGNRTRYSLYWEGKHHFEESDVLSLAYRYYWDDWQVKSSTYDIRYRYEMSGGSYLQPHLRYYSQSAAKFYHHSLPIGVNPAEASSDYRLAKSTATTLGITFGNELEDYFLKSYSVSFEVYQITGEKRPSDAIGSQRNYDMFPDLHAFIVQIDVGF